MPATPHNDSTAELGAETALAAVAEVDLGAGLVRVECGDVATQWIPWLERRSGATRSRSAPSVGEQGLLVCPGGDIEGAVFIPGVSSDAHPLPLEEKLEGLEFADGAVLSYDPDAHVLEVKLPENATTLIDSSGGVEINVTAGALKIYGDVEIHGDARIHGTATADTDVVGGGKSLKSHKHLGVTAGGAVSGLPQ